MLTNPIFLLPLAAFAVKIDYDMNLVQVGLESAKEGMPSDRFKRSDLEKENKIEKEASKAALAFGRKSSGRSGTSRTSTPSTSDGDCWLKTCKNGISCEFCDFDAVKDCLGFDCFEGTYNGVNTKQLKNIMYETDITLTNSSELAHSRLVLDDWQILPMSIISVSIQTVGRCTLFLGAVNPDNNIILWQERFEPQEG